MSNKKTYPIVIGGAGRTGKSLFAKQLSIAMYTIRKHYKAFKLTDRFDIFF